MAENYVPSSSQQGQGGAQILRGQTPRLSASGIVRGIEQAGQTLREEEKYKREKEALAQREKNAKIDALDESITSIQIPKLQYAGERAVEDFWSNIDKGEDFNSAYKELTSGLNYLTSLSNNLVKEKSAIGEGQFRYEDGTILDGKQGFSNLMEKGFNENQEEIYKQGGIESLGASVMSESSLMSNDFYEPSKHSFTETLGDYVVSKFKTNAEETASLLPLGGKTGVETKRAFKSPEQIKQDLKNNPEMFEIYKRSRTDAYRAEGKQEQLKADYDAYIDNYKLPEEVTVGYITKDTKDKGGLNFNFSGGNGENDKFYFKYASKKASPPPAVEGGVYVPRDTEGENLKFIEVEAKGTNPYQDFRTGEGQEVLRAALVSVKLDNEGNPVSLFLTNEEEVPYKDNAFILDKEYGLTLENIKNLYGQGKDTKDVLFYQTPDGKRYTPEQVKGILGEIPSDWEVVTEENVDMMDANLPKKKDTTTREDLNKRESERRGAQQESEEIDLGF